MITNEAEIRIALQATIASVLALYGFWGCALLVFLILLPWKPLLAVGGYLVQPVVDWRMQKARNRHEKGIAQIEEELDTFLRAPRRTPPASAPVPAAIPAPPQRLPLRSLQDADLWNPSSQLGWVSRSSRIRKQRPRTSPPHWRFPRLSRIMSATYPRVCLATWT